MSASYRLSFTSLTALCLLAALASAQCPNNDVNCGFCMGSQCVACNGALLNNGICTVPQSAADSTGCIAYGAPTTTTTNTATTTTTTLANGTVVVTNSTNNNGATTTNGNAYNSTNGGVCTQCVSGYYVVNNTCAINPVDNCASYTWTGGCTACFANVRAVHNNCNGDRYGNSTLGTNVTCGTKHCEVCGSNGVCQGCGRGYIFNTFTNSTTNTVAQNCTVYKAGYYGCLRLNDGVCTACRYGFYYRNGGCTGSELINSGTKRINGDSIYIGPNKLHGINSNNSTTSSATRGLVGLAFVVLAALF